MFQTVLNIPNKTGIISLQTNRIINNTNNWTMCFNFHSHPSPWIFRKNILNTTFLLSNEMIYKKYNYQIGYIENMLTNKSHNFFKNSDVVGTAEINDYIRINDFETKYDINKNLFKVKKGIYDLYINNVLDQDIIHNFYILNLREEIDISDETILGKWNKE